MGELIYGLGEVMVGVGMLFGLVGIVWLFTHKKDEQMARDRAKALKKCWSPDGGTTWYFNNEEDEKED